MRFGCSFTGQRCFGVRITQTFEKWSCGPHTVCMGLYRYTLKNDVLELLKIYMHHFCIII